MVQLFSIIEVIIESGDTLIAMSHLNKKLKHTSTEGKYFKKLGIAIAHIHGAGDMGIKRGALMIKTAVPGNQWQFYHMGLVDLEDIEYHKDDHVYVSTRKMRFD